MEDEVRALMDPDSWDWDHPEVIEPSETSGGIALALRLSREELRALDASVERSGLTLAEYFKRAGLERALRDSRKADVSKI